jgi:hypothetical protein
MVMLEVRYQGGIDTKQKSIHGKPKYAWNVIGLGPTKWELSLLLSTFLSYLMETPYDFDQDLVVVISHTIY